MSHFLLLDLEFGTLCVCVCFPQSFCIRLSFSNFRFLIHHWLHRCLIELIVLIMASFWCAISSRLVHYTPVQ